MIYFIIALVTILAGIYLNKKILIEFNVLQVNSYENDKMIRWLKDKETKVEFFKEFSLLFILIPLFLPNVLIMSTVTYILAGIILWILIKNLKNSNTKKPLVFTDRVKRMLMVIYTFGIMLLLIPKILLLLDVINMKYIVILEIILYVILSKITMYIIAITNNLLKPVEKKINDGFYNDAARILKEMPNLKIIGVTGSYGKTSTKYMVAGLLSEKYAVCKTPGSYNTLLGVIRTIREKLDRDDEVFVVEMGARHPNDIKEICDLVHPSEGIITAIGEAHLETFGNIDTIKETKFELARGLCNDKKLYVNIDNKNIFEKLASDLENNQKDYKVVTYSLKDPDADYYATNISYTGKGAKFDVIINNKDKIKFSVETKLLGLCNVYNVLGAIAISDNMGLTKEEIIKGTSKLEPVEHRLQILKSTNAITVIDDTFNANPEGTKEALEVLKRIEGNKKIVITPGMVEMGEKEYELNKEFGIDCIKSADYTIMVGYKQTKPMQDAFLDEKVSKDKYFVAKNLDEASEKLKEILEMGDVVLYENDMPEDV